MHRAVRHGPPKCQRLGERTTRPVNRSERDGVNTGSRRGVSPARPPSDATLGTPVVMARGRRSPRNSVLPWVRTTPPSIVTRLVLVSNTAVSPVTIWSFWVTTTLPLASSRLIDEAPPGPGVADWIGAGWAGADFAGAFELAGGAAAAELDS